MDFISPAPFGWPAFLGIVAILAVVLAVSVLLKRRRKSVWARFARRHHLQLVDAESGLRAVGNCGGRHVQLSVAHESSDTGVLGMQVVEMSAAILGALPAGLEVHGSPGVIGAVERAVEGDRLEIGDEEFDHEVVVKAESAADACRYLTPERRAALRQLVLESEHADARIHEGKVIIDERTMVSQIDHLENRLELLLRVAPILDAKA